MPTRPAPTAPRPGRRERRRAELRERIFRAALRLFAERGFTATTVGDITEAADVGKGTFFNYFPSKEHVLAAFGEVQVGKVEAAVADPRVAREPLRATMQRLVHALAEEPGRSARLVRALFVGIATSAPVRALVLANLERGRQGLAQLFVLGQRRGEVRRGIEPLRLAHLFQRALFGTMVLWAVDPQGELRERMDETFDAWWSGIGARHRR
jgi:AcrR family transcriptional regulator